MNDILEIKTPLTDDVIKSLKAGQLVYLTGTIMTARDAAHKKMVEILKSGEELDFPIENEVVYYAGPCPAKPGQAIGPVGPTTSGRIDAYSPYLIDKGLKFMIGKGVRNKEVKEAIVKSGGIYFAAIGGTGALISKCVKHAELVGFDELGAEAVRKLEVEKFPLIVAIDNEGNDVYEQAMKKC